MVNKRRPAKRIKPVEKEKEYLINENIKYNEVRIVGDCIESKVCPIREALDIADSMGLDLVLINDKVDVPICKIVEFSKFKYEQKKKLDEIKSKSSQNIVKEIILAPNIGEHDLEFKARHGIGFLQNGFSVKVTIRFVGRTIEFKEKGIAILNNFIEKLNEFGKIESNFKEDGKKIFVIILPKKKK